MNTLPFLISLVAAIGFGAFAIVSLRREKKAKAILDQHKLEERQHLYETRVLREIQSRIGYSIDAGEAMGLIMTNLDDLFSYSVASLAIIKDYKLVFKTFIHEPVGHEFLEDLREKMIRSLAASIDGHLPSDIEESILGVPPDENKSHPESFFHIPFVVNDKVLGVITIASSRPANYTEKEMMLFYSVTSMVTRTLARLEDMMQAEKSKLMAMIGSLADGIFVVDDKNQLVLINNAAKTFLHISKNDPNIIDVLSALPNTYDMSSRIGQVIRENKETVEKNFQIGDKFFEIHITPVHSSSVQTAQNVIGASVLLHDVTLEKSISQMKQDFTSIMVHELRSPLTSIRASTQLLLSTSDLNDEEKKKLITLISAQSNKLLDQVSLILDAAKLDAGLFKIQKVPDDLKKLIQERVALYLPQAEQKQLSIVVDIDPGLPLFSFDPQHMGQVVSNLISNSIKYTYEGGKIHILAKHEDGKITFSISDTGIGIPKDKQNMLFTKFSQIAAAGVPHRGTGLGLYIVKGVIDAHSGTISLESEEGKGTTITIALPADQIAQANVPLPTAMPIAH